MHYAICPVQEGYSVAFGKGPLVQQGPNKRVYYPTVSIDTSKEMIVIKPNEELTHYARKLPQLDSHVTQTLIVMLHLNARLNVSIRQAKPVTSVGTSGILFVQNREY